jgi:hypothetical protein
MTEGKGRKSYGEKDIEMDRKVNCKLFGGLVVSMLASGTQVPGPNPAEAVGFFGRKNPHHAFIRRESKAVGSMS